jgi:hypothetical protein
VADLDVVVDETDGGARHRHGVDRQSLRRPVTQGQERNGHRDDDHQPARRRRPLLDGVARRPLLANHLPELVAAQELDELRPSENRDDHGEQARREDSFH